jgi:hypothetical protein
MLPYHKRKRTSLLQLHEANNGALPLVLGVGGNKLSCRLETRDLSAFTAILSVSPL